MANKNKKPISLDDLVEMMTRESKRVDVKFDDLVEMMTRESKRVDARFDNLAEMIAKGFDNTVNKQEFGDLKTEVGDLKTEVGGIGRRLEKVEYQVDEVYDILKRFEENDILNLQKRVHILEKAVKVLAAQTQKS